MLQRMRAPLEDPVTRPLLKTGRPFYIFAAILLIFSAYFLYAWVEQLREGMIVTDLRTPVGSVWGAPITTFIFYACMAHGGMAVSALVRIFNVKAFKPVARMGEILTLITLMLAGICILVDLGRPDHVFNMILYFPERVTSSTLTWDMTVIILYLTLSMAYLWLTFRKDLYKYLSQFELRGVIYKILLIGYNPNQERVISKTARWLSIAFLSLIVMLSGGVIPWIFGLNEGREGWYGAMAGPYFLTAALTTSVAAVLLIAAVLRKIYHWEAQIPLTTFRWLAVILGFLTHFYLYLTFAELITAKYQASATSSAVTDILLSGNYSVAFWIMMIGGMALPGFAVLSPLVKRNWFSLKVSVISSVIILIAFWVKRLLIVVPSFLRPLMPFPSGTYAPSWGEWATVIGSVAIAILLYMVFIKLFPVLEVEEGDKNE